MTNRRQASPKQFFLRTSRMDNNPWEIGRAQPAIVDLVHQGVFQGKVLDIGCGIGDNAIYIASHARNVRLTAVDLVPSSVEIAYNKAKMNNVRIQFGVVDILHNLSRTNLRPYSYDIILDSAIFHNFSDQDRPRYIKNLKRLIKPGGLYIQLSRSEKDNQPSSRPPPVRKYDLYKLFSPRNGWIIESIQDTIYETRPDSPIGTFRAYLSFIRRNKNL